MSKLRYYAPAFGWGIFIFVLSTLPGKDFPQIPDMFDLLSVDKIVHMFMYGVLTWLILRGISSQEIFKRSKRNIFLIGLGVVIISAGFGWFLEWYQDRFCEDRLFEFLDGVANTIGAFISWISFSLLSIYRSHKTIK